MVRGKEARNVAIEEDKKMMRICLSVRLEMFDLLVRREGREKSRTPARFLASYTPTGMVLALYDAASARLLETPCRPRGDT